MAYMKSDGKIGNLLTTNKLLAASIKSQRLGFIEFFSLFLQEDTRDNSFGSHRHLKSRDTVLIEIGQ